jgi:hypothetical protein
MDKISLVSSLYNKQQSKSLSRVHVLTAHSGSWASSASSSLELTALLSLAWAETESTIVKMLAKKVVKSMMDEWMDERSNE